MAFRTEWSREDDDNSAYYGFSRPQVGKISVNGMSSWEKASEIQKDLGYLPGEVALPESLTGTEFIAMMAQLRGIKDMTYTNYLIEKFKLDASGSLKRMSLGMKRKLAIVTAFMHDPAVLILDEPTSALDPIMQKVFIEFIKEEKAKGKRYCFQVIFSMKLTLHATKFLLLRMVD